jgi:hypothetical protein
LLGYDVRYVSYAAFYSCSFAEVASGICAGDNTAATSTSQSQANELIKGLDSVASEWRFLTSKAETFSLTHDFLTPVSGDVMAVRFFNSSGADIAAEEQYLSLLIQGNLPSIAGESGYVGSDGRRIYFNLTPAP